MTRMSLAIAAAVVSLAAFPSPSAAQVAATAQPQAQLKPGDFYLDNSRVYVFVGKTGLGHEHGVVGRIKSGALVLDARSNAGKMVFDMTSFLADAPDARKYVGLKGESSASSQQQVTDNMLGADVLDAAHFPTATFVVHSSQRHAEDSRRGLPQYLLEGEFTLHGQTRPLRFLVEVEMVKGWQHVRGAFRINQSDFGIKPFTKAFGAVGVTDELTIWGDAWVAPTAGASS